MFTGEWWVANPIFPWVIIVLALWVGISTAVQARNWIRIRKLERANHLLQEMIIGGIHGLSQRITKSRSQRSDRSAEHRIQPEEPEPAAIEEAGEDDASVAPSEALLVNPPN